MDQPALVIDTNWVLDLCVFDDPGARPLLTELQAGRWRWLACDGMREELARVLGYPAVRRRLDGLGQDAAVVLGWFDRLATHTLAAPRCAWRCADPDDQRFIDLAVHHQAVLLSKDKAVLQMRRRLAQAGVRVESTWL